MLEFEDKKVQEGECKVAARETCASNYHDSCLNDCQGACIPNKLDEGSHVLEYPHMICD